MTKYLALFLALVMLLSVSCGTVENKSTDDGTSTETSDTTDTVVATEDSSDTVSTSQELPEPSEPTEPTEPDSPSPDSSGSTPLFYKVTDSDGSVVWLMGTIHAGLESFYPFPDYVMDAYEGADALAVECNVVAAENDLGTMSDMLAAMVLNDGSKVSDYIPADLYDSAKAYLDEHGVYMEYFDRFQPCLWEQLVSELKYEEAGIDLLLGVDRFFIKEANDDGKEIVDVEDLYEHLTLSARFSLPLQEYLLRQIVDTNAEELSAEIDEMLRIWAEGDEAAIIEMVNEEDDVSPDEQAIYEEYVRLMITERDALMTEFAVDALENNEEIFICVGMAHVAGEAGMVYQLREKGYTVEIVR